MNPADLYFLVRQKEGRIYPDTMVEQLPDIPNDHPLKGEWRARAFSARRLSRYLARLPRPLHILELGCGSGWLSSKIAKITGTRVWGLDRAGIELAQAARLFGRPNLAFLSADIFQFPFSEGSFDVIILASVIQYFPDLAALIRSLRLLLIPGGEIHVLDSPIYDASELMAARDRTQAYYATLGFPEMVGYYFHHTTAALEAFSPRWLYRPNVWYARALRSIGYVTSPFPWLCIH